MPCPSSTPYRSTVAAPSRLKAGAQASFSSLQPCSASRVRVRTATSCLQGGACVCVCVEGRRTHPSNLPFCGRDREYGTLILPLLWITLWILLPLLLCSRLYPATGEIRESVLPTGFLSSDGPEKLIRVVDLQSREVAQLYRSCKQTEVLETADFYDCGTS